MNQLLSATDINFTRNTFKLILKDAVFDNTPRFKEILPKLDYLFSYMTDKNLTEVVLADRIKEQSYITEIKRLKEEVISTKEYIKEQPATHSLNNGGETNYYDLPPESSRPCIDDLIEFKKMQRWQAEIFKSSYAIEDRAKRATDGSSSELRELNKMVYYVNRRLKQLGEDVYYSKA